MGTNDKEHQFEQIVARLTADYPSLNGRRRPSRRVLITLAVVGALVWGLLSVAMVAWGAAGVVLTCVLVAGVGAGVAADSRRRRWQRDRTVPARSITIDSFCGFRHSGVFGLLRRTG
jgi:hypothetical protein